MKRSEHSKGNRIVVVGGGFAGLACAHELSLAGFDVTVLEARERIGGRVKSIKGFVKDRVVEAGGEFIGANHAAWLSYANRFSLELVLNQSPNPRNHPLLVLDGKRLSWTTARAVRREMDAAFEEMTQDAVDIYEDAPWSGPNAQRFDYKTIRSWIEERECSELAKRCLDIYFASLLGVEADSAGCLGMLAAIKGGGLDRFWTDSELYHCMGGNSQLAERLAALITRIELQTPVSAVEIAEDCVRISCMNGETHVAAEVVLAVPPTTWQDIRFSPELPADLAPQMGANTKYLSAFRDRFWIDAGWPGSGTGDGCVQSVWEATAGYVGEGSAVLTAYSGANAARELQFASRSARKRLITESMETMYPGYSEKVCRSRFIDWIGDRWTRGAYSYPAPGQITRQGPILNAPLCNRMHFAGEHVCYKFGGYMEGALQSGIAVADRLKRKYR